MKLQDLERMIQLRETLKMLETINLNRENFPAECKLVSPNGLASVTLPLDLAEDLIYEVRKRLREELKRNGVEDA